VGVNQVAQQLHNTTQQQQQQQQQGWLWLWQQVIVKWCKAQGLLQLCAPAACAVDVHKTTQHVQACWQQQQQQQRQQLREV
jgi:hypothetical protein